MRTRRNLATGWAIASHIFRTWRLRPSVNHDFQYRLLTLTSGHRSLERNPGLVRSLSIDRNAAAQPIQITIVGTPSTTAS
jgi:hypothetical protein